MNKRLARVGAFYQTLSRKFSKGEVLTSAIVIAYYILFSIFPLIIIIGNVLPLFNIDTRPIAKYLSLIFPTEIAKFIMPVVNSLLKQTSTGYISFGIVFALWSFSSLVNAVRIGMNRVYDVRQLELQQRWPVAILTRSITIILAALMIMLFTSISLALIFGQQVLEFLRPIFSFSIGEIEKIFSYRYPVVILLLLVAIYYLNYALPNIKVEKKVILPGTLTTLIGWLLLSYLFGFYLHHFHISWENYGIFGTFIIFMLWLNLVSIVLLLGTCVNSAIVELRCGEVTYSVGRVAEYLRRQRRKH